jgi:DNA-binding LacI/PurR family transcriptional regulator/anti-anti-sigma regulatory factor
VSGVYYGNVLAGASQAAQRRGVRLMVFQESAAQLARSRLAVDHIDGWVAVLDTAGIEQIARFGAPIVTVSTPVPNLPAVCADNHGGMHAAVVHLIEHGHRRIGFIGRQANLDIKQRLDGYAQALAEHNLPLDQALIFDAGDELEPAGRDAARRLLESGVAFTAIVAGTDKNALGVLEVLRANGRRVPEDIALVGFDDVDEARLADPPLTTVRQRFDSLGSAAVDLLLDRLSGSAAGSGSINLPTALVVRRSCGCATGQSLIPPPGDAAASQDWRDALARELVELLLYPFQPDPESAPTQAWPGVDTLTETIAAALEDRDLPVSTAVEQAWQAGVALTTDLDFLNMAFDLLEQAGVRQLERAPDAAAHVRLTRAMRVLRAELLHARVLREASQVQYLDNIIRANIEIGTALREDTDAGALPLEWLRHTPASWGCLALWADAGGQQSLMLGSVYSRHGRLMLKPGARYRPEAFLATEMLPTLAPGEPDIVMLLPLRTARRDWGVLALGGAFETRFTWSGDPIVMWAEMLSAALERGVLLTELKQQQQTLQAAYEREHALTTALREIGSPVIPLLPGVLLVPLIGAIDSSRARQVIAAALEHVRSDHASDLLLDVTGVPIIDTQVASALLQLARMAALLGSRTVLVGVRPEIAQSIVGLGIDLAGIGTSPTLADAIRALQRRGVTG